MSRASTTSSSPCPRTPAATTTGSSPTPSSAATRASARPQSSCAHCRSRSSDSRLAALLGELEALADHRRLLEIGVELRGLGLAVLDLALEVGDLGLQPVD